MMSGWSRVDEETVVRFAEQNRQAIGKLVIDVNTPQFFGGQVDFSAEDCFEVEKLPDGRIVHVYRIPNERFGQA
jgi:hypothetical protein